MEKKYRSLVDKRNQWGTLYALAALALLGDVETLHSYQRRFAEGHYLGFVADSESAALDAFLLECAF
ncbi:DUF6990 domain-containing protein [Bartonella jaculi]|uniref:Uncharacterized protein n=1 Tax=Bartonella jaculi TaxID=686226 RepID=A0ABP9N7R6_9HYPH